MIIKDSVVAKNFRIRKFGVVDERYTETCLVLYLMPYGQFLEKNPL